MRILVSAILFSITLQTSTAQSNTARWQADITTLQTELPKRHPDPFRYYSKEAFETDLANLAVNLDGKTDLQIALELQTIIAKLGDANTRLELTPLLQQDKVIPLGLGWYADGLYVSGTVAKFSPALGKKVLGINRIRIEHVLLGMGRFFAKENDEAIRRDAPQWLRFPAAFQAASISKTDTLELVLEDEAGKQYLMKVFPLDFKKERNAMQPAQFVPESPDFRWSPMKQLFSLYWLTEEHIAYLQYNGCYSQEMQLAAGDPDGASQLPPFQPLVDSTFAFMGRDPDSRLFLDLRFNTGGNPADGIALAERLATMPQFNQPNRLYVAVNRYTAGAAVEIAAAFQAKTNATLIGEAPAQRPNHFADPGSLILPNSRIQVFYGTRPVQILPGDPAMLNLTVPAELPFAAFREGRDPLLDYVRKLGH